MTDFDEKKYVAFYNQFKVTIVDAVKFETFHASEKMSLELTWNMKDEDAYNSLSKVILINIHAIIYSHNVLKPYALRLVQERVTSWQLRAFDPQPPASTTGWNTTMEWSLQQGE